MLTLKRSVLIAGIGLAVAASSAAFAQPGAGWMAPAGRGPVAFETLDANRDGLVSPDEHALHRANRISARSAEGRLLRNAANAPAFADWDTDGDGKLTRAEVDDGQQSRFGSRRGTMAGAGFGPGYTQATGPGYGRGAGLGRGAPCRRNP
jgi:hypothetical protein